jgi:Transcription factor WhiB
MTNRYRTAVLAAAACAAAISLAACTVTTASPAPSPAPAASTVSVSGPDRPLSRTTERQAREIQQAKAVCASCPVRQPCPVYALTTHQEFWIWGGWDQNERRLLHRQWPETRGAAVLGTRGPRPAYGGSPAKAGSNVEIGQCLG